jgi:NAD(P)H-dependent FMN reductase
MPASTAPESQSCPLDARSIMSEPVLQVVVASTRPGRLGEPIGHWVQERAEAHGGFTVELVDLAAVDLPMFDEPGHPAMGEYHHDHTRQWSATVSRADAFVFVIPEYNHSFNAAIKNALDHLYAEWRDKPVGFVSYGGASGGTRAVAMLKPVVAALRMVPVVDGVVLPGIFSMVANGQFLPTDDTNRAAAAMLDELERLTGLLRPSRAGHD